MTGTDPSQPWKHLMPDPIDLMNSPALRSIHQLANQRLSATAGWENKPAFQQLNQIANRPLAGSGLTQFIDHRSETVTDAFARITGQANLDQIYRTTIAPSAFQFDPARLGIAGSASDLIAPLSSSWYVDQTALDWLYDYLGVLRRVGREHLPDNLAQIPDIGLFEVADFSLRTGIPLYRAPRRKIAQRLLAARKLSKARRVLIDHTAKIIDDCHAALQTCNAGTVTDQVGYAIDALDAARGGHLHAAQALATATLDSELTYQFDSKTDRKEITNHSTNPDGSFEDLGPTAALTLGPIWRAHRSYWPTNGDPIPRRYNRHATIHAVGRRQFRKSNAIIALMVLTSFICWITDTDTSGTHPGADSNGA